MNFVISLLVLSAISKFGQAQTKMLEVGKRYLTDNLQVAMSKRYQLFVASTCHHYQGKDVVISVLLRNNQQWLVDDGVVYFDVTNTATAGEVITKDKVLCSNYMGLPQPVSNCTVKNWQVADNLYIHTRSGDVEGIPYTMVVEFVDKVAENLHEQTWNEVKRSVTEMSQLKFASRVYKRPIFEPFAPSTDPIYLIQSVHLNIDVTLPYRSNILLNMSFCPNSQTGEQYRIDSTIFAIGPQSAFNQYACLVPNCKIDTPQVFASNPKMLPLNILPLQTRTGSLMQLYILVRCWGGDYDPSRKTYMGKFRYAADIQRN